MGGQADIIRKILAGQSEEIAALAQALRDLVQEAALELVEEGKAGWGNIVYKGNGVVGAISPHKRHVNLHLYKGTSIPDPGGLLQGSGKELRRVRLEPGQAFDRNAVMELIRRAHDLDRAQ